MNINPPDANPEIIVPAEPNANAVVYKKKRPNRSFRWFFREMLPVGTGVILALFLNRIVENWNERRTMRTTLKGLSGEFRTNWEYLHSYGVNHEKLINAFETYEKTDSMSFKKVFRIVEGFQYTNFYNASWQNALNTGVRYLDYQTISVLAAIDEQQTSTIKQYDRMADFLYANFAFRTPDKETNQSVKETFLIMLYDLTQSENELLRRYQRFDTLMVNEGIEPSYYQLEKASKK